MHATQVLSLLDLKVDEVIDSIVTPPRPASYTTSYEVRGAFARFIAREEVKPDNEIGGVTADDMMVMFGERLRARNDANVDTAGYGLRIPSLIEREYIDSQPN